MERRQFNRILFSANTRLQVGGQNWHASLVDLSFKGALIARPKEFDGCLEDPVALDIILEGAGQPISMQGHICHLEESRIGIMADELTIDSATQLRRVLELNLADDALLQRDFKAMIEPGGH